MQLVSARLVNVGPFPDVTFPFVDDGGGPRAVTVIHAGGGMGKTTLLSALAATRPGHTTVSLRAGASGPTPPHAICDWLLGDDDKDRPHPLRVVTPNVKLGDDEAAVVARREQAHFDREAKRGGYMFLSIPAHRWFSRQPFALSAPLRTVARYDVRASGSLEDSTRFDLSRETKQSLAYAAITSALAPESDVDCSEQELLGAAMSDVVDLLVGLAGYRYHGLEPRSFEPWFSHGSQRRVPFDALATHARNLVAIGALCVRALWASRPGVDPRSTQGVVAVDEVDAHLDAGLQEVIVPHLREALPRVQWIVSTSSPRIAASVPPEAVLALRRMPDEDQVVLYTGPRAVTH